MTSPEKIPAADHAVAFALFAATFAILAFVAGDLFPLMEFRDWSFGQAGWADLSVGLEQIWLGLTRQTPFARGVGLAVAAWGSDACRPDILCMNLVVLAPVALAAGLLHLVARALGAGSWPAAAGAVFWLVSAPVADAVFWQATIFDRCALVGILAAILVYLRFTATSLAPSGLVACNLAVLALTALALMSKEVAFPLPAILLLLALVDIGHRATVKRRLFALALPVAYAAFYEIAYLTDYQAISPAWQGHVLGGDIMGNARFFSRILLPVTDRPAIAAAVGLLALALAVGLAWKGTAGRLQARAAALALVSALLLAAPMLRLHVQLFYYLYVPLAFLAMGYALLATAIAREVPRRPWRIAALAALAVPLVAGPAQFLATGMRAYDHQREASANFRASFERLRGFDPAGDLAIVLMPTDFPSHNFTEGTLRALWRYIDGAAAERIDPLRRAPWRYAPACPERGACIRYDGMLRLVEVRP